MYLFIFNSFNNIKNINKLGVAFTSDNTDEVICKVHSFTSDFGLKQLLVRKGDVLSVVAVGEQGIPIQGEDGNNTNTENVCRFLTTLRKESSKYPSYYPGIKLFI